MPLHRFGLSVSTPSRRDPLFHFRSGGFTRFGRPLPRGRSCSDFVVSRHLAGLFHRMSCGFVAPRYRSWGSPCSEGLLIARSLVRSRFLLFMARDPSKLCLNPQRPYLRFHLGSGSTLLPFAAHFYMNLTSGSFSENESVMMAWCFHRDSHDASLGFSVQDIASFEAADSGDEISRCRPGALLQARRIQVSPVFLYFHRENRFFSLSFTGDPRLNSGREADFQEGPPLVSRISEARSATRHGLDQIYSRQIA